MSRMMLTAGALCLAIPYSAIAAVSHTKARYATTQESKALVPAQHINPRAFTSMRFTIRGRTATWDFTFSCSGYRCKFQNSHHARDTEESSYVTIAEVFDSELSDIADQETITPATGSNHTAVSGARELYELGVTGSER